MKRRIHATSWPELLKAVRATHPSGGVQTARSCVCGQGCGGPARPGACQQLEHLLEIVRKAEAVVRAAEAALDNIQVHTKIEEELRERLTDYYRTTLTVS